MTAAERRQRILDILCVRRHVQYSVLKKECGACRSTIFNDVCALSLSYPVYTSTGRYGGVHLVDGFYPSKANLTKEQLELLKRLLQTLSGNDKEIMLSIIKSNERRTENEKT